MIIFINPHACGGKAMKKWKEIESSFKPSLRFALYPINEMNEIKRRISAALREDETDFVAAGGDGTIHFLLNALIKTATPDQLTTVRLGAIGLGSSNDFHKPFTREKMIGHIPCTIDFYSAKMRDIGCVSLNAGGIPATKYFLINASVGITAEANARFNTPGRFLQCLKRINTSCAIISTALRQIAAFKTIAVTLQSPDKGECTVHLSNLGIMKNPHFSGSLRYSLPICYDDGLLRIVLAEKLSRWGLLKLLFALSHEYGREKTPLKSWATTALTVKSESSFALEFDGETLETSEAHFSLLPHYLKVCTC